MVSGSVAVSRSFELPDVEWATVGTVGEPGQRTFYLQARQGDQLVTLKLEKQQVAAMAQFLGEMLSDLPVPADIPDGAALDLVEPVLAEWAVGGLQLAYDSTADRIVVLAEEIGIDTGDDEEEPEVEIGGEQIHVRPPGEPGEELGIGRFGLTRPQAAGIARRGLTLVQAGRPTCALCGNPIDPEGHSCPRTNGHRSHPS
jgi:uncharacterized repeat protein (TIGR03847 family)